MKIDAMEMDAKELYKYIEKLNIGEEGIEKIEENDLAMHRRTAERLGKQLKEIEQEVE